MDADRMLKMLLFRVECDDTYIVIECLNLKSIAILVYLK